MNPLGDLVSQGYTQAQKIVALCAFFMLIYAGLRMMLGQDKEAKQIIQDVVIGLVLLFSAYVILNTINHSFVSQSGSPALPQRGQSTNTSSTTQSSGTAGTTFFTAPAPGSGVLAPSTDTTSSGTNFFTAPAPGSGVLLPGSGQ